MKKLQTAKSQFLSGKQLYISIMFFIGLLTFSSLVFLIGNGNVTGVPKVEAAKNTVTGEWTAQLNSKKPGEIHLMIQRRSSKNGFNSMGTSFPLSELQGLSPEATSSARTNVNFRIVREAGTFEFEGYFREGRGAGFWKLIPNPNFISAMRSRGYDNLSAEKLFLAAIGNLTVKLVEELKTAGYERLSFDDLVEAAMFDVTPEFIRSWRSTEFKNISFRQLLELGMHEVKPEFIAEMKAAGFESLTLQELIEARMFDVDRQFVSDVRALGFTRMPFRSVVEMRMHDVTPEFIGAWRVAGFQELSLEDLIELGTHEVTPEYLNQIKAEGFPQISPRQAAEMKIHDIDRDFIRRARAKFPNLTLKELIELRINDIVK